MGADYAWVGLRKRGDELRLVQVACPGADTGGVEKEVASAPGAPTVWLRARVANDANVRFSYSTDGSAYTAIGEPVTAKAGRWVGAKVGLFALGTGPAWEFGYSDVDWFRIEAAE